MRVLDVMGKAVETLIDEPKAAGRYSIQFPTNRLMNRAYIAEVKVGKDQQCKLIVVTR